MSHRAFLLFSSVVVVVSPACGPADPAAPDWEERSSAIARDDDGKPDVPDTDPADDSADDCPGGAKTYLISADSFDYADHANNTLTDRAFTLFLCSSHFPLGSAARAEVEAAAALYNAVAGTDIFITVGSTSHRDIAELFPANPTGNFMDVVDNSAIGFPCHAAGDIEPDSWTMNLCPHDVGGAWAGGGASVDHFVISVNANAYRFDTIATAIDYPKFENIAHEIGHAFGLNHSKYWPVTNERALLSTMQGNLPLLPPHDRGYLRHFYPSGTTGLTLNLVASPKVRLPSASEDSGFFNYDSNIANRNPLHLVNPHELYLANGTYLDCNTQATPVFQAQWLNNGQIPTSCTVRNRFRIGPAALEASNTKITIKNWIAAKMPAASQDRIATAVTIDQAALASLSHAVPYELTFKVDWDNAYSETNETDNVVASTITLHDSLLQCPNKFGGTPPEETAPAAPANAPPFTF